MRWSPKGSRQCTSSWRSSGQPDSSGSSDWQKRRRGASVATEAVVVRLHIDAPRDVVFECFCDPAALVTWMGDRAELDPRPGGVFPVDINAMEVRGEFKAVERPSRLVFSWGFVGSALQPWAHSV